MAKVNECIEIRCFEDEKKIKEWQIYIYEERDGCIVQEPNMEALQTSRP